MLIKRIFLILPIFVAWALMAGFLYSCAPGFQSDPTTMEDLIPTPQDDGDEDDGPLPPPPPGTTTTTTNVVPPPTTTTLPRPPGGDIDCPAYGGRFRTAQQIINYSDARGDQSCIRLNGSLIKQGFGPCVQCWQDGWTPPSTTTTLPPGPTTTTRPPTSTTGWPTTTTRPGSAW